MASDLTPEQRAALPGLLEAARLQGRYTMAQGIAAHGARHRLEALAPALASGYLALEAERDALAARLAEVEPVAAAAVAFIAAHRVFTRTPTGQDAREADERDRALHELRFAVESRAAAREGDQHG